MNAPRGVYAIYDRASLASDRLDAVEAVLSAGAVWLQYRDKRESAPDRGLLAELAALTQSHGAKLIVNDDWRLAVEIGADGVHLGQSDGSVTQARSAFGPNAIIGISCQDRIERARAGIAAGASYVSFGRFFTSTTKPDAPPAAPGVLTAARELGVPVVAIGGINAGNAATLIDAGADLVAVSAGLFAAADPGAATAELDRLFADRAQN
ncbi:thiamine phosphate synthase [Salinisphaera hydrothermalis]|uniref:Thiamine-phosphate synthase n=1 Tax=Salinisphaera hydrothermalis (strain C41B8) TaxID=1304275 RepID=A0A084IR64_SALHC|nr:thiamine phosphate synthase [Salinisphaera hydrothermalis]KEZ79198.1 thiamine-phosphate pyrophosphorylase [Salinisphaera hydrothermalis C41B8]